MSGIAKKGFEVLFWGVAGCELHVRLVDLSSSGIRWLFPKTGEVRVSSFPFMYSFSPCPYIPRMNNEETQRAVYWRELSASSSLLTGGAGVLPLHHAVVLQRSSRGFARVWYYKVRACGSARWAAQRVFPSVSGQSVALPLCPDCLPLKLVYLEFNLNFPQKSVTELLFYK